MKLNELFHNADQMWVIENVGPALIYNTQLTLYNNKEN